MKLLVVEDDPELAALLVEGLSEDGYAVERTGSAREADAMLELGGYSGLILDVMLPEGDQAGFRLARALRDKGNNLPILYLTARDQLEDLEQGLGSGGDDYLTKPFTFRELRARLQALIRRSRGVASPLVPLPSGWALDLAGRDAVHERKRANLTRREYALLEHLALHPQRAFTRPDLIERLWPGDADVDLKIIDVYVSTIRRKLDANVITTLRGTGYRLGEVPSGRTGKTA